MKNSETLNILTDMIDLHRETLEVLKEAIIALKAAVDELKAARLSTPTLYTSPFGIGTNPWRYGNYNAKQNANVTFTNTSETKSQPVFVGVIDG
jgi:hypothetical protein